MTETNIQSITISTFMSPKQRMGIIVNFVHLVISQLWDLWFKGRER